MRQRQRFEAASRVGAAEAGKDLVVEGEGVMVAAGSTYLMYTLVFVPEYLVNESLFIFHLMLMAVACVGLWWLKMRAPSSRVQQQHCDQTLVYPSCEEEVEIFDLDSASN